MGGGIKPQPQGRCCGVVRREGQNKGPASALSAARSAEGRSEVRAAGQAMRTSQSPQ